MATIFFYQSRSQGQKDICVYTWIQHLEAIHLEATVCEGFSFTWGFGNVARLKRLCCCIGILKLRFYCLLRSDLKGDTWTEMWDDVGSGSSWFSTKQWSPVPKPSWLLAVCFFLVGSLSYRNKAIRSWLFEKRPHDSIWSIYITFFKGILAAHSLQGLLLLNSEKLHPHTDRAHTHSGIYIEICEKSVVLVDARSLGFPRLTSVPLWRAPPGRWWDESLDGLNPVQGQRVFVLFLATLKVRISSRFKKTCVSWTINFRKITLGFDIIHIMQIYNVERGDFSFFLPYKVGPY